MSEKTDKTGNDVVSDPTIGESYPDAPKAETNLAGAEPVEIIEEALDDASDETDRVEPETITEAAPVIHQTTVRKGGAGAMVLGGVIAAGLGYGAAYMAGPDGWPFGQKTDTSALEQEIADLKAQLAEVVKPSDLDAIGTQVQGVEETVTGFGDTLTSLSGQVETVVQSTTDLGARLATVEKRPSGDGTLDDTAIQAYETEVAALREAVNQQNVDLQGMQTEAANRIAALETAASQVEQTSAALQEQANTARAAAELAEAKAAARSGLSQIEKALSQGGGYADALPAVAGLLDVPAVVADNAAEGVAPLADLQGGFDAAARGALNTVRASGEAGDEGGGVLTGFLRKQLSVRSSTPKDGTTADAILSRVEAAVNSGQLDTALIEIDALPQSAKDALGDWLSSASTRQAVTEAVTGLSDQLTAK